MKSTAATFPANFDKFILKHFANLAPETVAVTGQSLVLTGGCDGALGIKNESHVVETKTSKILFGRRRTAAGDKNRTKP